MATVLDAPARKVSVPLLIGIVLLPVIFAWFLLRRGYSTRARVIAFAWMVIVLGAAAAPRHHPIANDASFHEASGAEPAADSASSSTWTVTADQFSALRTGMTHKQVEQIIGSPGEELSSSDLAGIKTVMVGWKNWDGSNMNAMFQNDHLVSKSQFGLH